MNHPRVNHTLTLLDDGRVLAVGGRDHPKTAEIYDPAANTWTMAEAPTNSHVIHTAQRLPDGRVLVAGGFTDAEIYDPAAAAGYRWQPAPHLLERRSACSAVLNDGRVLVVGGHDATSSHMSLTIFDGSSDSWSVVSVLMKVPRACCTATTLANGKVLIVGGMNMDNDDISDLLEIYDPENGTIRTLDQKLPEGVWQHNVSLLGDGRVLITGGICGPFEEDCRVSSGATYDPVSDAVATMAFPLQPHGSLTLALHDGRALASGGTDAETHTADKALVLDSKGSEWLPTPAIPGLFSDHEGVLLADGRVLIAGGYGDVFSWPEKTDIVATAALFTP